MDIIELVAKERSSYFITATFLDEDGVSFIPDELFWKLTDANGSPINGRDQVEILTPAATVTIPLTGDDLAVNSDGIATRLITFWGEYTSDVHGSELPFRMQAQFNIEPEKG